MKTIVLASLIVVSQWVSGQALKPITPEATGGNLDLRDWNFQENKIALNGYWSFYEHEFVPPSEVKTKSGTPSRFPEVWKETTQFGTYHLTLLLHQDVPKLAFAIPQMYNSYELWINGKKIANNGKPGTTRETSIPQWMPQIVPFESDGDTLDIVLHISNFYHDKGGVKDALYLGTAESLENHWAIAVTSNFAEAITLTLLGFAFLIIYYVREEKKKITLYFSLLCLSWAIRSLFSNHYVLIPYFPDFNWTIMVKIEYLTIYSMLIWAILFLGRLFPNESNNIFKYVLVAVNIAFVVITVVSPPLFFTKWLTLYLSVAGILLFFGAVIVIRALINERAGVWYLVACTLLSLMLFSYNIFVYKGFIGEYNAVLFSSGYILLFVMMGIALLYHLKVFKSDSSSGTLTFEDLYGKNK